MLAVANFIISVLALVSKCKQKQQIKKAERVGADDEVRSNSFTQEKSKMEKSIDDNNDNFSMESEPVDTQ